LGLGTRKTRSEGYESRWGKTDGKNTHLQGSLGFEEKKNCSKGEKKREPDASRGS